MISTQQFSDKRHLTGLVSLDQKLGMEFSDVKGIPDGSLILVEVPPSASIPLLFVQRILLNWATNENNYIFYMFSSRPKILIQRELNAYKWSTAEYENKNWFWQDMRQVTTTHRASSSRVGAIDIKRKTYTKNVFKTMEQYKKEKGITPFSIIDDLLWMKEELLDENPSEVMEFLKDLLDLIQRLGGVHFFVLPNGILNHVVENILEAFSQGIFRFSREIRGAKLRDFLTITKLTGVAFVSEELEVTPSEKLGFQIESTRKI